MIIPTDCPICDLKLVRFDENPCCFECSTDSHSLSVCRYSSEIHLEIVDINVFVEIFVSYTSFYDTKEYNLLYKFDRFLPIEEAIDFAKNKLPMIRIFK